MTGSAHQMSFKKNLKCSIFILLLMFTSPVLGLCFYFSSQNIEVLRLIKITSLTFIGSGILWIPGLILHLSYYFADKGKKVFLNKDNLEIISKNASYRIKFSDVDKIEKISYSGSIKCPWMDYAFTKLYIKDKSIAKITCLTADTFTLSLEVSRKAKIKIDDQSYTFPFLFL
jgi:hypothetical protein